MSAGCRGMTCLRSACTSVPHAVRINALSNVSAEHASALVSGLARSMSRDRPGLLLWFSYIARVAQINALEAVTAALSDKELAVKTADFKQMLARGKRMDDLLPEAFAVVREASRRILNMRHFDVQLVRPLYLGIMHTIPAQLQRLTRRSKDT